MKLQTESAETTYSMYPGEGFLVYVTAWRDAFCSLKEEKSDRQSCRERNKQIYFEMPARYENLAYYVPETTSEVFIRPRP